MIKLSIHKGQIQQSEENILSHPALKKEEKNENNKSTENYNNGENEISEINTNWFTITRNGK